MSKTKSHKTKSKLKQDEALFIKEHKHIIVGKEKAFRSLVSVATELAYNHNNIMQNYEELNGEIVPLGTKAKRSKQLRNKIKLLERKQNDFEKLKLSQIVESEKELDTIISSIKSLIKKHQDAKPPSTQGGRKKHGYKLLAECIKYFWKDDLGHKHFFYSTHLDHVDNGRVFAESFIRFIYGEFPKDMPEALRDMEDIKKKSS